MPSQYTKVKKFAGVYFSESKINTFRGKPDRTYWINFRDFSTKKLRWKQCGKASEGWTPEAAQKFRVEQLEKDRAGEYKSALQAKTDALTLDEFMQNHYMPWARQNQKRPDDDFSRYNTWIKKDLGKLVFAQITTTHVEKIVNDMKAVGRALATQKHVVKLIKHIFNQATELQLWEGSDPLKCLKFPKINNARLRFLAVEEANLLLFELRKRSVQTAQIAAVSLYSGMRLSEVCSLKWKDINADHGIITVLDSKNGESRPVFITGPIRGILAELPSGLPEEYLFDTPHGDAVKPLSHTFFRVVDSIGFNQGITDRRQRVSFHTLRHTYASWAVMAGVPLYQVGKALGHKSSAMTERYSHLAPESQRMVFEAVAAFHNQAS
jgi:integrase